MKHLLIVLSLVACSGPAQQINENEHVLRNMALRAGATHAVQCTAPAPQTGARPIKPAKCSLLLDCLRQLDQAAQTCASYQRQIGATGVGNGSICETNRLHALEVCSVAGITPAAIVDGGAHVDR